MELRDVQYWADESCLRITASTFYPHLKIGFYRGYHYDNSPFDGRGKVLAHAFYPSVGQIHFDNDEYWTHGSTIGLCHCQWRRQHLLRGGTKLEIRSWGTHGGLHGRVQQLLDD